MSQHVEITFKKTPFGELILGSYQDRLCLCDWRYRNARESIYSRIKESLKVGFKENATDVTREAVKQLDQYFIAERKCFDLPLRPVGSEFQKRVWKALLEIPYGRTTTYSGLSEKLGDKDAIRAVAAANGANALAIFIPCHRVIGRDGRLTGYAGGLSAKKQLLRLENALLQTELDL
jgi:methylated-DNA-[protein]-cysteine S-methyltransferase